MALNSTDTGCRRERRGWYSCCVPNDLQTEARCAGAEVTATSTGMWVGGDVLWVTQADPEAAVVGRLGVPGHGTSERPCS
jgi:hypothetical protein